MIFFCQTVENRIEIGFDEVVKTQVTKRIITSNCKKNFLEFISSSPVWCSTVTTVSEAKLFQSVFDSRIFRLALTLFKREKFI